MGIFSRWYFLFFFLINSFKRLEESPCWNHFIYFLFHFKWSTSYFFLEIFRSSAFQICSLIFRWLPYFGLFRIFGKVFMNPIQSNFQFELDQTSVWEKLCYLHHTLSGRVEYHDTPLSYAILLLWSCLGYFFFGYKAYKLLFCVHISIWIWRQ